MMLGSFEGGSVARGVVGGRGGSSYIIMLCVDSSTFLVV